MFLLYTHYRTRVSTTIATHWYREREKAMENDSKFRKLCSSVSSRLDVWLADMWEVDRQNGVVRMMKISPTRKLLVLRVC